MIEEETLISIVEGFIEQLENIVGVDPVEAVRMHHHSPADEVLDFAFHDSKDRSINLAFELVQRAADEGGRWQDLARAAAYHEWGHAFTNLIEDNVRKGGGVSIDPSVASEGLSKPGGVNIDDITIEHEQVDRETLVAAVERLHDEGYIDYGDLEVPNGRQIRSGSDYVEVIEEVGIQRGGRNEVNDPLGHSLGDSIAKNVLGVDRRGLHSGIIELANDLGLVSRTGLIEGDSQQERLAREMQDVPTATVVRMTYPDRDSEGERVIVEGGGVALTNPPRHEVEVKMDGDRIFEGMVITIPNKAKMAEGTGGTFESRVEEVEPESGARIKEGATRVEWVKE